MLRRRSCKSTPASQRQRLRLTEKVVIAEPVNLFYQEPDPDRWFALDRFPRRLIRRIIRGKRCPGGQERVFLNLRKGLDRLGVAYRVNDYKYAKENPRELVCVIGKPHVLDQ